MTTRHLLKMNLIHDSSYEDYPRHQWHWKVVRLFLHLVAYPCVNSYNLVRFSIHETRLWMHLLPEVIWLGILRIRVINYEISSDYRSKWEWKYCTSEWLFEHHMTRLFTPAVNHKSGRIECIESLDWEWKAVLVGGRRCRPRDVSKKALKGWKPGDWGSLFYGNRGDDCQGSRAGEARCDKVPTKIL